MDLFSKDIVTVDDLFLHQLQDVYCTENQITKALPKMIDKALRLMIIGGDGWTFVMHPLIGRCHIR